MTYYESAQDLTISRKRAVQEVERHYCSVDEFLEEMGTKSKYNAQAVLEWLGY